MKLACELVWWGIVLTALVTSHGKTHLLWHYRFGAVEG